MPFSHPAFVAVAAWLAWVGIERAIGDDRRGKEASIESGLVIGAIALTAYVAVIAWYALQPVYFDPAEPTITAVSSVFGAGKPLYPALDAPERYAHIYGPDLFIIHAAAMKVLGARVVVSKAVGALAALASLVLAYAAFVSVAGRRAAFVAIGVCAAVYLAFGNITFWTRPEPLLMLCAAAALYGVASGKRMTPIWLVAVVAGVSLNLKFSGPLYILPALGAVVARRHRRDWIAMAAIFIVFAIAPFLMSRVSAAHYFQYIQLSARNGLMMARLRQNVEWALVLAAPVMAGAVAGRGGGPGRRIDPFNVLLTFSIVVVVIVAAKPGAGPYHLLPALPLLAYGALRLPVRAWDAVANRAMAAAVVITACVFAVQKQSTFIRTVRSSDVADATSDARTFIDGHPSASIGVGYAGTSRWADARVEAVFRTHDYWLDAPAIQEHRLAGLAIPASAIGALEKCRTRYWLIPIAGDPFVVPSAYWPDVGPPRVFSDDFVEAFLRSYARVGETRYFSVWECRR